MHLAVKNNGNKVTEVYIYEGKRIVTEKENIGPGTSYKLTSSLRPAATRSPANPA